MYYFRSLNKEQRQLFQHIFEHCTRLNSSEQTVEPFYIFASGGAGTGKSHLISALYQMSMRTLYSSNPNEILCAVTAPTGSAAFNIKGFTKIKYYHKN